MSCWGVMFRVFTVGGIVFGVHGCSFRIWCLGFGDCGVVSKYADLGSSVCGGLQFKVWALDFDDWGLSARLCYILLKMDATTSTTIHCRLHVAYMIT